MTTIEELVPALITGFTLIGGALGIVAFVRQTLRERSEKKEILGRNVLRPWGDAKLQNVWKGDEGNIFGIFVPKASVPPEVTLNPPEEGFEIRSFPGLWKGMRFLRRKARRRYQEWSEIERLRISYETSRGRKRRRIEAMVREDMAREYPQFQPEGEEHGPGPLEVYSVTGIVWTAETTSYYEKWFGQTRSVHLNHNPTTQDDRTVYVVRSERFLLRAPNAELARVETLRGLFAKWIGSPDVGASSAEMVRIYREVEEKLADFCEGLRQVAGNVALGEL